MHGACRSSVPFVSGTGGYAAYRIPAVVRTPAGTLLAFAEGRVHGTGDAGAVDIVLRRSADGGCNWGPRRWSRPGTGTPGAIRRPWSTRAAVTWSW
ncbi:hypothetical protein GCM10017752_61330 [Streptomyces roseoviridis]